jgi:hypothetical protein
MTAPIALFVYNRPMHTRQTVESLQRNLLADKSDLFVYSDAPKSDAAANSVAEVRDYVRRINGFKSVTIIEREKNWGVDPSIIDGVTTLCAKFGSVIVLEDDLVTSNWFLKYMNDGLELYRHNKSVMQISGFMFPLVGFSERKACFLPYSTCWGWATWKRAWDQFNPSPVDGYEVLKNDGQQRKAFNLNGSYDYFGLLQQYIEGKLDAWDIRWYLSVFMQKGLTLFPQKSLVHNIGFDGSGVHCPVSDHAGSEITLTEIIEFPEVAPDNAVWKAIQFYLYSQRWPGRRHIFKRIFKRYSLSDHDPSLVGS